MTMILTMLGITFLAGVVQGVTGFGAGIVMMMVLPMFFETLGTAAGVSTAIAVILSGTMVYTYRKFVEPKKIIPPAILYIAVCSAVIVVSKYINQAIMKKVFGVFLVILAIYYLFINKSNEKKKLSLPVSLAFIIISAACDGLFGIGGPLMVLYFLSTTHNTHEYLGNIQAFFFINCIYNTFFRFYNGIIGLEHLQYFVIGWIGILVGGFVANKLVNKIDGNLVKKLTYVMIGVAGIINII